MDRLQGLRAFVAVAEHGGFAAAARALDLSPPSITRLVAELEAELGVRLFHRTTRRVALTEEGTLYLERVRSLLADLEEADALVAQRSHRVDGVLRVLATPMLANVLVAPLLPRLADAHPHLRVEVDVQSYGIPAVEGHDVALFAVEGEADTGLIARRVASGHSALVASPAYLRRMGTPAHPADLARHRCLRFRGPDTHRHAWTLTRLDGPRERVDIPLEPVVCSNHVETLMRVALSDGGIVAVALDLVAQPLAQGALVRVLPDWVADRWSLYAALPSRRHLPARTRVFLDELGGAARALQHRRDDVQGDL